MDVKKERSRLWNLVLYPDDPVHANAMDIIRREYQYVAILHDKDCDENGELKKAHWHIILKFAQARWNTAIADYLGITPNYMERTAHWDGSAQYLLHYGCEGQGKYPYESDELEGNLIPAVLKLLADDDENVRVLKVCDIILESDTLTTMSLVRKCCEAGLYGDLRRLGILAARMIDEHNRGD